ncbi:MAG: hypothetical protein E7013_05095 [Alphaproteobacteria bacterium]|nr:hypothetical protein [Alphaproteobacteria bacterium]
MITEVLFPSSSPKTVMRVTQDMREDLNYWEAKFQEMNFPGMDLVEATAYPVSLLEKISRKKQYKRVKRDFIKYLIYNFTNDLRNAGLTDEDLFYFKKGILPENFNIHLKIPFDYTGNVDFSNMVLMQSRPYHEDIHRFMDMQMSGMDVGVIPEKIYIPVPTGKVYIPLTMYTGSGGKGKHDRSVFAGYSESAFEKLAQKTMRGAR